MIKIFHVSSFIGFLYLAFNIHIAFIIGALLNLVAFICEIVVDKFKFNTEKELI